MISRSSVSAVFHREMAELARSVRLFRRFAWSDGLTMSDRTVMTSLVNFSVRLGRGDGQDSEVDDDGSIGNWD